MPLPQLIFDQKELLTLNTRVAPSKVPFLYSLSMIRFARASRASRDTRGARRVVVDLYPLLCNQTVFTPAVPAQRQQLQRRWPAHAPIMKTATVYAAAFWFEKGYNGQVACIDGPVIWSFDNSLPDNQLGVLNAFMRAAELPSDPELAKTAVVEVVADALQDAHGRSRAIQRRSACLRERAGRPHLGGAAGAH